MELTHKNSTVEVKGNITTVADFDAIKETLEKVKMNTQTLTLKIHDSLVINSSLIGYLVKIINQDKIEISLLAGNEILFELLDDLGLANTFNLQKI